MSDVTGGGVGGRGDVQRETGARGVGAGPASRVGFRERARGEERALMLVLARVLRVLVLL